ncbi:hypothetical protein BRADI_1g19735v3 [Brachypodium distachyon]|uniref:Alpha/beta hydrolase fold-3 domain-containing protein n=1 Tax=Brachypodium distachyon TaxID=15368 RepID=A0A0Q3KUU6_BRADI|nr:hypothetical protein BRADI_1g19735v3 [Brachypodium distachyon]
MEAAGGEKTTKRSAWLPWTVRVHVMALGAAGDWAQRPVGTVNRFLFLITDRRARAPTPRTAACAPLTTPVPLPVVVYFHGGGLFFFEQVSEAVGGLGPAGRHVRFARALGAAVVSVDYRLAPEHHFPAAYDDGEAALRYLAANDGIFSVSVDLSRCFLAGDSAGGNIAHHVAHRWTSDPQAQPSPDPALRLAGIILLQPYFGGEERTESELSLGGVAPVAFFPVAADRNHPAAHVTGEAGPEPELGEGFLPAMVAVGGLDPLQDWQRRYAAMLLRRKGKKAVRLVEFPDAIHCFYMFPELPDAGKLVEETKAFIQTCTAHH